MFDYLVDHALKNVWCTPDQDMQTIVKPARITGPTGVFGQVEVLWRKLALPLSGVRFHVYAIGQLHPLMMGLFPIQETWMTIAEACNRQSMVADIYSNNGVQLPRTGIWYMITPDKDLILAVQEQPRTPIALPTEDIFVRVYSNAYFQSIRANAASDVVKVDGKTVLSTDDILALQNSFNALKTQPGLVYAFVNGMSVSTIDMFTAKVGDRVEYVYDSSVKHVVELPIDSLPSFVSTLDSKHKYLVHFTGTGDNTIDYHDDVDVYILKKDTSGRATGVFYHRNQADAVRQVTHKDYAVTVPYVLGYTNYLWGNTTGAYLQLRIRKSGYDRPLVNENNRIKELYKLNDADLIDAMVGLDAVVDNWKAEVLEASVYAEIMRSRASEVVPAKVQSAYGYNAISKLLADTPSASSLYSDQYVVKVPYGLQTRAVGYEYDADGLLLGWYSHSAGSIYATRDFRARLVEMLAGAADDRLDEVYGDTTVQLDPNANYRMYRCPMVGGVPSNVWEDVTDSAMYAVDANSVLTWLIDPTLYYTLVRSDKVMLAYTIALSARAGAIRFSLTHRQLRNSVINEYVMQIPMGELDLWLNKRSLIEGIDYVVNFPEIVIINKEFLVNPTTDDQIVDIRFSGFCNADMSREIPQDRGFIEYGLLSHNTRFDIRDDKVMRIVVHGKLYDRSELLFSESNSGVEVPDVRNGAPYMLRDIVVPLRGLTQGNTYTLRAASQAIDKKISDYMTLKLPEPTHSVPSVISQEYAVISPFMCKILYDLLNKVLDDPRIYDFYNDMLVLELCQPYEFLLKYDPTQESNRLDDRYVIVHGHNQSGVMDISIYYYQFLTRVNRLYLNNMVEMSHFFRLAP